MFDPLNTGSWIKDDKITGTERLADCPSLIDPGDIGTPTYFVSHAWSAHAPPLPYTHVQVSLAPLLISHGPSFRRSPFAKLLDTVFSFLRNAPEETTVWVDVVAINQHQDTRPDANAADVAAFERTLKICTAGTIVVVDMPTCSPASRAWCLYEWDHTVKYHGLDGLHLEGMSLEDRDRIVREIDVEQAECFMPADKDMILAKIAEHHGSAAAFNTALKLQLLLEPISHEVRWHALYTLPPMGVCPSLPFPPQADLTQLARRSEGTAWTLGPVEAWLQGEGPRALCIEAGAGEGKSTISAALLRRWGGPP